MIYAATAIAAGTGGGLAGLAVVFLLVVAIKGKWWEA